MAGAIQQLLQDSAQANSLDSAFESTDGPDENDQTPEPRHILVVEAGTGTGKTLAYLVPAMRCIATTGQKVIVSTGTKALQDQLFHKDLPLARKALSLPVRSALLKGRANYVCLYRMARAESLGGRLKPKEESLLADLRAWNAVSDNGDLEAYSEQGRLGRVRSRVVSNADNCLGSDCPDFEACHVYKARRRAQSADLVVVNHHLLLADLAMRDAGQGELLPDADCVIVDEAHQIPELAAEFLSESVTTRQLQELARDTRAEYLEHTGDSGIREYTDGLMTAVDNLIWALGQGQSRLSWNEVEGKITEPLQNLQAVIDELLQQIASCSEMNKGLAAVERRIRLLQSRISRLHEHEAGVIRWLEFLRQGAAMHLTPLNISDALRRLLSGYSQCWVFTSATLTVDNAFNHYLALMGLQRPRCLMLEQGFDYEKQALLHLPKLYSQPNDPAYVREVSQLSLELIMASGGGAFILCTSYRALNAVAEFLSREYQGEILLQGERPRNELLEKFRTHGNSVLIGTSSFWEGVDVRGSALRLVIIDKLPFASPADPVYAARLDAIREQGGSPFMDYQLPQAVITLKQGVGRLIRDVNDRGVLVLCDPRLHSKGYGRVFLRSLPPMKRASNLEEALEFFRDELSKTEGQVTA